jgi:hypothetical protein
MSAEVDEVEERFCSRAPLRSRQVAEPGQHVAGRRQMREQRVLLEDEAGGASIRWNERPAGGVGPRLGAGSNRRMCGPVQPRNRTKNRRFATARRAEDCQDFARLTGELDVQWNWTRLSERDRQGTVSHGMG